MELKTYQSRCLSYLDQYLDELSKVGEPSSAYANFWKNKNVRIGFQGLPSYSSVLGGCPHVCFKVPTGGGKTFIAAAALRKLFQGLKVSNNKLVVWLVPSDSILEQTLKSFKDPTHPYRLRLENDFNGRVEVYSKQDALAGRGFNSVSVEDQLSLLIVSYDSFRAKDKEGRKVYQQNGNLVSFAQSFGEENPDDASLVGIISKIQPVVVVDESHNATSDLSIDMLKRLNPRFVLDLTATPKETSNVICYVSARELKAEQMVKLPVIAYNRPDQNQVIIDAVDLRNHLEAVAKEDMKKTGRYIRPIVLFQAEPKTDDDSTTFDKIKAKLVAAHIPEEQIAIKTATKNEIRGIELSSNHCPIRYIITVNALKEGWDCPFAYILATIANRSSKVDVEQILGRILRLPHTAENPSQYLNMGYVLTSSDDFSATLNQIIKGLNSAGFSNRDYRAPSIHEVTPAPTQIPLPQVEGNSSDPTDAINPNNISDALTSREAKGQGETPTSELLSKAAQEGDQYQKESDANDGLLGDQPFGEEAENMNIYSINESFKDIEKIALPRFYMHIETPLFGIQDVPFSREMLDESFTLRDKPIPPNVTNSSENIYLYDIDKTSDDSGIKYQKLSNAQIDDFKKQLDSKPQAIRISMCRRVLLYALKDFSQVSHKELVEYVDRIVSPMTPDELQSLQANTYAIADRIHAYVVNLIEEHRKKTFYDGIEKQTIFVKKDYSFPLSISPLDGGSGKSKTLYSSEKNDLNNTENAIIDDLIALDNVRWWHRIAAKGDKEFFINGWINHYPDFILGTNSGNVILVEVKGEDRKNDDSAEKLVLGRKWASMAGKGFSYYMAFLNDEMDADGSVQVNKLLDIIKSL
jgi:type III restriction enzyme